MNDKTQMEDMMATWTRLQKDFWQPYVNMGGLLPTTPFKQSLQASEDMMQNCLKAQCDCGRAMLKSLNPGEDAPEFANQYYESMVDAVENCMDISKNALDSWFKGVEGLDPSGSNPMTSLSDSANNIFHAWQKATEDSMQAQTKFMSTMLHAGEDDTGQKRAKSRQGKEKPATKAAAA